MAKVSCGLSIDMLTPFIEDTVVDNPKIGVPDGVPIQEVYRQALLDVADRFDDFRSTIQSVATGTSDFTSLVTVEIPALISELHGIKMNTELNEEFDYGERNSVPIYRKNMQVVIESLISEWDLETKVTGKAGQSSKDTTIDESTLLDGDSPVGNIDVEVEDIGKKISIDQWFSNVTGESSHRSMDSIIRDSLGIELIGKAPDLMDLLKEVISYSLADTRVDAKGVRFTMNKRRIRNAIKGKLREAVSLYYTSNAVASARVEPTKAMDKVSTSGDNVLFLTPEQLPGNIKDPIIKEGNIAVFKSPSIVGADGQPMLLVSAIGDADLVSEGSSVLGIDNTTLGTTEGINSQLNKQTVVDNPTDQNINSYLAQVILNNFDSMVKNNMPFLHESHKEKFRKGSVELTDSMSGNQATAITKANIITTPKLVMAVRGNLNDTVNLLERNIKRRSNQTIKQIFDESGIIDSLTGDKNVTRVRRPDGSFEDIVVLNINNVRHPLLFNRVSKEWESVIRVVNGEFTTETVDTADTEAPLLDLLNTVFKQDGIKETKNLFGAPEEVPLGSIAVTINNVAKSLQDNVLKGTQILETSGNSYNKFLAEEELESMSRLLLDLPQDLKDAGETLKKEIGKRYGAEADILRGLYHKFFDPKEYYVTRKNPVTGRRETEKHVSLYRLSKMNMKGSQSAKNQLIALKSTLNTISPNEFINMINGTAIMSNTIGGDAIKNNMDSVDFHNTVLQGNIFYTRDSAFSKFKVSSIPQTNDFQVIFNPGKNQRVITITANSSAYGGGSFKVFPFVMKDAGEATMKDMENMLRALGLPTKFATKDFLSLTDGVVSKTDIQNFITTLVGIKLANGYDRKFRSSGAQLLTQNLIDREKTLAGPRFSMNEHLPNDFKKDLGSVLDKFEGLSVRKFVSDHEHNRRMTTATVNKALRIQQVLKDAKAVGAKNMYSSGFFAQGKLTIEGLYSKNGIIEGLEGKSNSGMSTKEQFKFLVEGAFLSVGEQKNFKQAAFQSSTKSDRKTVGTILTGRSGDSSFMPIAKSGLLDRESLQSDVIEAQSAFYTNLEGTVISEWTGNGTKFGKGLLQRMYDRDVVINNTEGVQSVITMDQIARASKSLRDLHTVLGELSLDSKEVRLKGGIISNLGIDNKGKAASIRYSTVRTVEIMTDPKAAEEFLEMNKKMFYRAVDKTFGRSYVPSQEATKVIQRRFGDIAFGEVRKTILDSFFYNDLLVSSEIQRLETGPIEQFKSRKPSLLEGLYGAKDSEIVSKIKGMVKGKSFEELANDTRLGVAKKIVEDPIMSTKQKVKLLEFDDLASQLSPAYIDQVKRNQGVGTSLQMFVKASETEGGVLVGKNTSCVTIDDPSFDLQLLGSTGNANVDIYDATMIMHPIEMIKYNNSLGGEMSNFSSKGGAFKDANVSSTAEGYYVYQKKASQPLFGTEFLINGTPEHQQLMRKLNQQVKFGAIPLYVENTQNEAVIEGTQNINSELILKYGESLGKMKDANDEFVTAEYLLFQLHNKEISSEDIDSMGLTTNKILKSFDNIQEVWDHFGGLEGDYVRLLEKDDEISKHPFGYGWEKTAEVISNYRSNEGNYPLRDAYIGKVGFASQEKSGSRSVNPASSLNDNSVFESESIPNSDSGIILQPDHDPDTTASMNTKTEDKHDSDIKVITQILSAAVGEGEGFNNVKEILDTVGAVVDMAMDEFEAEIDEFGEKYRGNITDREVSDEEAKQAGYLSIAYNLTKKSMLTRKDPGITGSIIFDNEPNEVNFDHKAVLPVLRTAVNSELNKRTVNLRFKGNQTVVTASHDQLKSYTFGPTKGLFRTTINKLADKYIEDGLELPEGWELQTVNQLDNLADTDSVYQILDDGTKVRMTFGKLRKMKDVQGKFVSTFSPVNKIEEKGNRLEWLDYTDVEGNNLKDTPQFNRFIEAGAFYQAAKSGVIDLNDYQGFEEVDVQSAIEAINGKTFVKDMAVDLHNLLREPGKWLTTEAEFYVPPMHKSAFLISDFDTLHDIVGTNPQPNTKRLSFLGLISDRDVEILDRRWSSSEATEILDRARVEAEKLGVSDQFDRYLLEKKDQIKSMTDYFGGSATSKGKVDIEIEEAKRIFDPKNEKDEKHLKALLKTHSILGLLEGRPSPKRAIEMVEMIIKDNPTVSNKQISLLTALKGELANAKTDGKVSSLINSTIEEYKQYWVQSLVDNFPYTLTFISARIPASGKQSYVAAKVKNFIFSTRNASYGPLELIGISGADYDIDKQNNLTWDVDVYGKVFDWLDYEDENGSLLSTTSIRKMLQDEVDGYGEVVAGLDISDAQRREAIAIFRKSKIDDMSRRLQNRVVYGLMKNITDPKNAIEAATAVAMSKLNNIKNDLAKYDYGLISESSILQRALKGDPKADALLKKLDESDNLPRDLKDVKKALDTGDIQKYADSALVRLLERRDHALPFSPLTKMIYERVNLDGKTGIGIFASALKGYFASYYAWIGNKGLLEYRRVVDEMRDTGELEEFPSFGEANDEVMRRLSEDSAYELEKLQFSSPYVSRKENNKIDNAKSTLTNKDIEILGTDLNEKALQIVSRNPDGTFDLKNITALANSGKWGVDGYIHTQRAQEAMSQLKLVTDPVGQSDIIKKFMEDIDMLNSMNVEDQAWADLSELLNAATDNAKELILGYIGASDTTDALIAGMVIMGVDLHVALGLLNDPQVKSVIKKLEDNDYLFGSKSSEFIQTLSKSLKGKARQYKFDPEAFAEAHPELSPEDLAKQVVMAKLYNPMRQMGTFAEVGAELTSLASGFLGINQGLPNNDYDVFNFIRKANKSLQTGTFEEFIGDADRRREIVDSFEKVGINVPYIISNNPHYFGQFKALNLTNEIVDSVSFVSGLVRADLLKHTGERVDELAYRIHTNNVYGLLVDAYYNEKNKVNSSKVTISGETFDLSTPKGRIDFVKFMPDVIADFQSNDKHSDNVFLRKLFISAESQDRDTGDIIPMIQGPASTTMTEADISILRANVAVMKTTNPDLYNALFNYSLVVDRGGLSKGSVAEYFSSNDYLDYNNFVQRGDIESKLKSTFNNMTPESRQLLTPILMRSESADAAFYKKKNQEDEQEMDEDNSARFNAERLSNRFSTGWLNSKRAKFKGEDFPNIVKIKELGRLVAWNEKLGSYLPIVKTNPDISIPISVTGISSNNDIFDVKRFGYDYGWEVKIESDFKGGKTGRILRKSSALRGSWYDVLVDGVVKQFSSVEIKNFNPGIILKGQKIDVGRMGKPTVDRTLFYNPSNGKVSIKQVSGTFIPVDIDSSLEYLYDSSDNAIYDPEFAKFVRVTSPKVDGNFVIENFTESPVIKNFRKALVTSAYRIEDVSDGLLSDTQIEETDNTAAVAIRNKFDKASFIDILTTMRGGKKAWGKFITDTIYTTGYTWDITNKEFDEKKIPSKFTKAELAFLTDPAYAPSISIGQALKLLKQIGISEQVYFDRVISKQGLDRVAYISEVGTIMNGIKFIPDSIKNPRIQESKDYVIPESLSFDANKLIGAKSLKKIAKVMNQRFKNTTTSVLSPGEITSKYGEKYAKLRGFVINGQIVLNSEKASLSTPLHELGHIYLAYLKDEDQELYDYIVGESLNSDLRENIEKAYPELSSTDVGEEIFVEMLGLQFGKDLVTISSNNGVWNNIKRRLSDSKSFGKVLNFFRDFFNDITGGKINKDVEITMSDSISSVVNKLGDKLVYGRKSVFNDFTSPEKTALRLSNPGGTMTPEALVNLLTKQGYIRQVCP